MTCAQSRRLYNDARVSIATRNRAIGRQRTRRRRRRRPGEKHTRVFVCVDAVAANDTVRRWCKRADESSGDVLKRLFSSGFEGKAKEYSFDL